MVMKPAPRATRIINPARESHRLSFDSPKRNESLMEVVSHNKSNMNERKAIKTIHTMATNLVYSAAGASAPLEVSQHRLKSSDAKPFLVSGNAGGAFPTTIAGSIMASGAIASLMASANNNKTKTNKKNAFERGLGVSEKENGKFDDAMSPKFERMLYACLHRQNSRPQSTVHILTLLLHPIYFHYSVGRGFQWSSRVGGGEW
jgi:hypothetical protein